MSLFQFTPATSVYRTAFGPAFGSDTADADTLDVDAGAFLIATNGYGAALTNTGAWTVTVDGTILSQNADGLYLTAGNSGTSTVTVGAEGEIGGSQSGVYAQSAASITNAGQITGATAGMTLAAGGSVTNTGLIEGGTHAFAGGASAVSLVNDGTMGGHVFLGSSADTLANSGLIDGLVSLGEGADVFTNYRTVGGVTRSGTLTSYIDLGAGNDRFLGGSNAETVLDSYGADFVSFAGGSDIYDAVGYAFDTATDTVSGGSGTDLYDASRAGQNVVVNLDTVAHDLGPLAPRAGTAAGGRATIGLSSSGGVSADTISGFDNARGGTSYDLLYGHGGANVLEGMGNSDRLFGYGGNDHLEGGAGNDNLVGGLGRDVLTGGADVDVFTFVSRTDSGICSLTRDVITDFQDGVELIDVSFIDATSGTNTNDAFSFIGTNVTWGGQAGQLRAMWTSAGQVIQADTNGDKVADFSVLVQDAVHGIQFASSDFLL